MPVIEWNEKNMKYAMCFFPLIGVVTGGIQYLAGSVMYHLSVGRILLAAVMTLLPVVVSGGIHLDGFMDTMDALGSCGDRQKKLEILKDSNAGAFAVITACVYFLAWFGAYSELRGRKTAVAVLCVGFMVSRSLSGMGVILLPKAKEDGTVAEFSRKSEDKTVRNVLIVYLLLLLLLMLMIHPVYGAAAFLTAILIFGYYRHMALKYFGGTTGDLSGAFLCLCEVGMALVLAVVSHVI